MLAINFDLIWSSSPVHSRVELPCDIPRHWLAGYIDILHRKNKTKQKTHAGYIIDMEIFGYLVCILWFLEIHCVQLLYWTCSAVPVHTWEPVDATVATVSQSQLYERIVDWSREVSASALYIALVSCVGIYHLRVIYGVTYMVNIPSNIIYFPPISMTVPAKLVPRNRRTTIFRRTSERRKQKQRRRRERMGVTRKEKVCQQWTAILTTTRSKLQQVTDIHKENW